MNVPTKFRGKDIATDEYVYGDKVFQGVLYQRIGRTLVKNDSVQQLAGYDEQGNEVYKKAGWSDTRI